MVDADPIRKAVKEALASQDEVITDWVLVYETSIIDSDGDTASSWGAIISASQATSLGLLRLAANDIEYESTKETS